MENSIYNIGDVRFHPAEQALVFNRFRSVKLSKRENLILQYMLNHPNKAITLAELIQKCLNEFQSDPLNTRKSVQLLSTKLELADCIEYPYIDCYMFRCDQDPIEKIGLLNFKWFKQIFNRSTQVNKALVNECWLTKALTF